jgi:hypothetical protein
MVALDSLGQVGRVVVDEAQQGRPAGVLPEQTKEVRPDPQLQGVTVVQLQDRGPAGLGQSGWVGRERLGSQRFASGAVVRAYPLR